MCIGSLAQDQGSVFSFNPGTSEPPPPPPPPATPTPRAEPPIPGGNQDLRGARKRRGKDRFRITESSGAENPKGTRPKRKQPALPTTGLNI